MRAGRGFSGEGVAGGQSVVDLLAALKKEKDPDIKSQIISALGRIGAGSGDKEKEAIAKELIEVMDSATGPVLPAAINALGRLKTQTATEPLLNQLRLNLGIDSLVEDIVRALGEIRDPKAVDLVVIMLEKHSKQAIRIEAAIALGKIRGHKALEALKRRLNQETDSNVKAEIAKAIHTPPVSLHWTFN